MASRRQAPSSLKEDAIPWEAIDALVAGAALLKFGRTGEPHFRFFQLSFDCTSLGWYSQKKDKKQSRVLLQHCGLVEGQSSEVFKRQPRPDLADVSFSLLYESSGTRTLDVICKDRLEYITWTTALAYLAQGPPPADLVNERRRTVWAGVMSFVDGEAGAEKELRRANFSRDLKSRIKETCDVFGFGASPWGQLGLGDEGVHPEPTLIAPLLGKAVRMVACGPQHAIALADTGEAFAFGNGGCGRLGTGGADHELSPRLLLQPQQGAPASGRVPWRFRSVAAGDQHSLGVGLDGCAYAWGSGRYGALGVPLERGAAGSAAAAAVDVLSPTRVPLFVAIQREREDAAAPRSGSAGAAAGPEAADSAHSLRLLACQPPIVSVAAGLGYSAFVDAAGCVYTCGIRDAPLGHNRGYLRSLLRSGDDDRGPMDVAAVADTVQGQPIGAPPAPSISNRDGAAATAVIRSFIGPVDDDGADMCGVGDGSGWGDLLVPVQVGIPGPGQQPPPSGPSLREQAISVSLGPFHAAVATSSGACYAWGANTTGALGLGDTQDRNVPTRVTQLPRDVVAVACGAAHTLALVQGRGDGRRDVYAFGATALGQVPHAPSATTTASRGGGGRSQPDRSDRRRCVTSPQLVQLPVPPAAGGDAPTDAAAAAAGEPPGPMPTTVSPRSVAAGFFHSAVITDDGALYVFGSGASGEAGITAGTLPEALKRVRASQEAAAAGSSGYPVRKQRPGVQSRLERIMSLAAPKPGASRVSAVSLASPGTPSSDKPRLQAYDDVETASSPSATDLSASPVKASSAGDDIVAADGRALFGINSAVGSSSSSGGGGRFSFSDADTAVTVSSASGLSRQTTIGADGFPVSAPTATQDALPSSIDGGTARRRYHDEGEDVSEGGGDDGDAWEGGEEEDDGVDHDDLRPRSLVANVYRQRGALGDGAPAWFGAYDDELAAADGLATASGAPVSPPARGGGGSVSPTKRGGATAPGPPGGQQASSLHAAAGATGAGGTSAAGRLGRAGTAGPGNRTVDSVQSDRRGAAVTDWDSGAPAARVQSDALAADWSRSGGASASAGSSTGPARPGGGSLLQRAMSATLFGSARKQTPAAAAAASAPSFGPGPGAAAAAGGGFSLSVLSTTPGDGGSAQSSAGTGDGGGGGGPAPPPGPDAAAAAPGGATSAIAPLLLRGSRGPRESDGDAEQLLDQPIPTTRPYGPLPVPALSRREVRSVACGAGFTICTVATQWMRDEEAPCCMRCDAPFGIAISRRRHHCRNCGAVVCQPCSGRRLPLLKLGYIEPVRVCDGCYARLQVVQQE